jgi:hypothetical protein
LQKSGPYTDGPITEQSTRQTKLKVESIPNFAANSGGHTLWSEVPLLKDSTHIQLGDRLCGLAVKSSWLQIQRPRFGFPKLPDFLRSSETRTRSTQPGEDNWGAIRMKKVATPGLENPRLTTVGPRDILYQQKLALTLPRSGGHSVCIIRFPIRKMAIEISISPTMQIEKFCLRQVCIRRKQNYLLAIRRRADLETRAPTELRAMQRYSPWSVGPSCCTLPRFHKTC